MATCPKVVKCAAAALVALVFAFGVWYGLHCRDLDRVADETKVESSRLEAAAKLLKADLEAKNAAQDAYVLLKGDQRDKQFREVSEKIEKLATDAASNGAKLDMVIVTLERIEKRLSRHMDGIQAPDDVARNGNGKKP